MRDDSETVSGNYFSMKGTIFQENRKSRTALTKSINNPSFKTQTCAKCTFRNCAEIGGFAGQFWKTFRELTTSAP